MTLRDVFQEASELLIAEMQKELRDQGHYLTGALEQSFAGTITENEKGISVEGTAAYYAQILNLGVVPENVPYLRGSGAGTSQYITALIKYFKLRGLDDKEAIRAAFATANKQKQEGMPTLGSDRYSSTGSRMYFVQAVKDRVDSQLNTLVLDGIDAVINLTFHETPSETI